jgi:hypothetical protein
VSVNCTSNGLDYDVTVKNSSSCAQVRPYRVQVQYKLHGGPWIGGGTQYGVRAFPPGNTHVVGSFQCGVDYPANADMERVEFTLDSSNHECHPKKKSAVVHCTCGTGQTRGSFHDVPADSPFFDGVTSLVYANAISGYSDGTFKPSNTATRAQVAKVIVLAFNLPLESTDTQHFSDVPADSSLFVYIETAYSRGILSGYADGTFNPNGGVTRGQIAKMVVTAAGLPLLNPSRASFSDAPENSTFYQYIETAKAAGILSGYEDGTFRPELQATRGQVSKIISFGLKIED